VRKRKFVATTDSNHTRKVYPNLAHDMILTAINQLWQADITYSRLRDEFVFLAMILDAYSRRIIGWALDRSMEDSLTLTALRMALARRAVGPAWSIIPTAARNMPARTTRTCSRPMASTSACRAKATRGTTRLASRS
jgi:transposase InsO family protein